MNIDPRVPPFPYWGGKATVAGLVWERFGDVNLFLDPFCGGNSIMFGRPHWDWESLSWREARPRLEIANDISSYLCVGPETRILMSDLTWLPAGELRIGARLLAFDEENSEQVRELRAPSSYRHWRLSKVLAIERVIKPSYRLTFDDGTIVIASTDHSWLTGSHRTGQKPWRWMQTVKMKCGPKNQSCVLKLVPVIEQDISWRSGWIAGIFDGEGSIHVGPGTQIHFFQNFGPVLDQTKATLEEFGFQFKHRPVDSRTSQFFSINGGLSENLRFLMTFRPVRLLAKFIERSERISIYGRSPQVAYLTKKEFLGPQEVISITTTSRTFIAEGLASHNCNALRGLANAPELVAQFAAWPATEADLHARHIYLLKHEYSLTRKTIGDPDYFDPKLAGYWLWAMAVSLGGLLCRRTGPWTSRFGLLERGKPGKSVVLTRPHLSNKMGVRKSVLPVSRERIALLESWFRVLSKRLDDAIITCHNWKSIMSACRNTKLKVKGVFLDPPYSQAKTNRDTLIYVSDKDAPELSEEVREWAVKHGNDPGLRIALCGYEGEHNMPDDWEKIAWTTQGGFANWGKKRKDNRFRERIWFSPHCLRPEQEEQTRLF